MDNSKFPCSTGLRVSERLAYVQRARAGYRLETASPAPPPIISRCNGIDR